MDPKIQISLILMFCRYKSGALTTELLDRKDLVLRMLFLSCVPKSRQIIPFYTRKSNIARVSYERYNVCVKLIYALLCDNAFLSIDKKVNIIGVFETINAPSFPISHTKFTLVGSVIPSKDRFKMTIDIVEGSTKTSILKDQQEREIVLPIQNQGKNFNFIIEILNTTFPKNGVYKVQVKIDGEVVSTQDLLLAQTQNLTEPN